MDTSGSVAGAAVSTFSAGFSSDLVAVAGEVSVFLFSSFGFAGSSCFLAVFLAALTDFFSSFAGVATSFFAFGSSFLTTGLGVVTGFFSVVVVGAVTLAGFLSSSFLTVTTGFFSIFFVSSGFFSSSAFVSAYLTGVLVAL